LVLLRHKFDRPGIDPALEAFLRSIRDVFGDSLVSVIVYGSLVSGDLSPGYGDLDFLAVVKEDIPEAMYTVMSDLRRPFKSGTMAIVGTMIEGEFIPRKSLHSPETGQSYYWGTSSDKPRLGSSVRGLVARCVHELGVVIYGEDIRPEIPFPARDKVIQDVRDSVASIREHGKGGRLHSVDWLLMIARFLILVREDRLSSKTEAAEWGAVNANGAWRRYLPEAKRIRMDPWTAESADVKGWLASLTEPIQQACDELEQALSEAQV
jgi:hypothetical protein